MAIVDALAGRLEAAARVDEAIETRAAADLGIT